MRRRLLLPVLLIACFLPFGAPSGTMVRAATLHTMRCASSVPHRSSTGPEVRGITTRGTLWALLFYGPPAKVGIREKIVVRITGRGAIHVMGVGPNGQRIRPSWGPEAHGGSNWNRPGDEWGTGWTFTVAGCWHLHVKRVGASGNVWLRVSG